MYIKRGLIPAVLFHLSCTTLETCSIVVLCNFENNETVVKCLLSVKSVDV